MRDAKRLVKVQVRDIRAKVARSAKGYLGVHVCSVHVDLTTSLMNHVTNFNYFFLENTIGRRICEHQAGQPVFVLFGLDLECGKLFVENLSYRVQSSTDRNTFAFSWAKSMLPALSVLTGSTINPAIWAEAGFVPWAETGIRQTFRCFWSMESRYALIARSPEYSPWAPLCESISSEWSWVMEVKRYY